ncbi:hypothetical protein CKQ90_33935, partial [Klebsiella pneumoniae]
FQTSLQFPQIQRFDEHFVLDLLVDDGQARGLVAMNMMEGTLVQIRANAASRPPFSFPKFSALMNISSLTCWSMTGRPAAW